MKRKRGRSNICINVIYTYILRRNIIKEYYLFPLFVSPDTPKAITWAESAETYYYWLSADRRHVVPITFDASSSVPDRHCLWCSASTFSDSLSSTSSPSCGSNTIQNERNACRNCCTGMASHRCECAGVPARDTRLRLS